MLFEVRHSPQISHSQQISAFLYAQAVELQVGPPEPPTNQTGHERPANCSTERVQTFMLAALGTLVIVPLDKPTDTKLTHQAAMTCAREYPTMGW